MSVVEVDLNEGTGSKPRRRSDTRRASGPRSAPDQPAEPRDRARRRPGVRGSTGARRRPRRPAHAVVSAAAPYLARRRSTVGSRRLRLPLTSDRSQQQGVHDRVPERLIATVSASRIVRSASPARPFARRTRRRSCQEPSRCAAPSARSCWKSPPPTRRASGRPSLTPPASRVCPPPRNHAQIRSAPRRAQIGGQPLRSQRTRSPTREPARPSRTASRARAQIKESAEDDREPSSPRAGEFLHQSREAFRPAGVGRPHTSSSSKSSVSREPVMAARYPRSSGASVRLSPPRFDNDPLRSRIPKSSPIR